MGQDEIDAGQLKIKNMYLEQETVVERAEILDSLKSLVTQYEEDLASGKVVFKECKEEEEDKPQRGQRGADRKQKKKKD